ncbi:hypothetical protein [Candidatus Neoehrlichia procyonis]|uniref:Uncharacterized protein n=1 Tax=Candidatus Neoehrlichia procyonis str. RAC413 TaxID=1359163 RepID=A0A0F3NPH2_9RICK|nr:hypothetical protein [Candidatus Neoehrlichia lotoris]KJV69641.1 hypothetical protein NLO413_1041 [Candidatus Neoehrlichia lotoris str. RAC413]
MFLYHIHNSIFYKAFSKITTNSLINNTQISNDVLSGYTASIDFNRTNIRINNNIVKKDYETYTKDGLIREIMRTQHSMPSELNNLCTIYNTTTQNFLEKCPARYLLHIKYKSLFCKYCNVQPDIRLTNEIITNCNQGGFISSIVYALMSELYTTQKPLLSHNCIVFKVGDKSSTFITIPDQPSNAKTANTISVNESITFIFFNTLGYQCSVPVQLTYTISLVSNIIKYHNVKISGDIPYKLQEDINQNIQHTLLSRIKNKITMFFYRICAYISSCIYGCQPIPEEENDILIDNKKSSSFSLTRTLEDLYIYTHKLPETKQFCLEEHNNLIKNHHANTKFQENITNLQHQENITNLQHQDNITNLQHQENITNPQHKKKISQTENLQLTSIERQKPSNNKHIS